MKPRRTNSRPARGKPSDPSRRGADSILHAVAEGGQIALETLLELLVRLRPKTDYHVHVQVAALPSGSTLLKTIALTGGGS
jgi:hypothetical protein